MDAETLPQYEVIALNIAARIANGTIHEGAKLYGRSVLASEYAAAVGFPAFAALYWKKATTAGICSGMISGFVVSLGWKFIGNPGGISESVAGIVICIVLTVTVSLLTYKKEAPTPFCEVTSVGNQGTSVVN